MFKAIATGKNTCYGKKDEEITISDHFVVTAIKNEWIKMEGLAYVGLGGGATVPKDKAIQMIPFVKIDLLNILKTQNRQILRMTEQLLLNLIQMN